MSEPDHYMSITALTRYVKRLLDKDPKIHDVWVRGEISNFKHHSRGHMYFTLKDKNARISVIMFAGQNRDLAFHPEDGMKVLARGEVSVYEPYGQYQLYVQEMQPDGIGSLYLAYEKLKQSLEEEGLFSPEHKKTLPVFPQEIAIVTSRTGAAIRDIYTTIKRRLPTCQMTVFPVIVQGRSAATSIASAIEHANRVGGFDLLIVSRGGGSVEELWAFNEEITARSIFASRIPVISAVGHETDYTIADFVADMRAPTPTGAGELAVPDQRECFEKVANARERLKSIMKGHITSKKEKLKRLKSSYAFRYPRQWVRQKEQELDSQLERLGREAKKQVHMQVGNWRQLDKILKRSHPQHSIQTAESKRQQVTKRLCREIVGHLDKQNRSFQENVSKLKMLSPLHIMERGFSLTYSEQDNLIKSVNQAKPGELVTVVLRDGRLHCHVWGIEFEEMNDGRK